MAGQRLPIGVVASALGLVHALVDAATVAAVFRVVPSLAPGRLDGFTLVLAYDLLAFASQAPLGLLVDARRLGRFAALAGVALSGLALAASGAEAGAVATLLLAGLGNALFHVGGGALVLPECRGRTAPAGVFVAPGALGLGLGMYLGRTPAAPAWPLLVACAVAVAVVAAVSARARREPPRPDPLPASRGEAGQVEEGFASRSLVPPLHAERGERSGGGVVQGAATAVALCLVSVAVRSYVGFAAPHAAPKGFLLLVGLPLAGFAGKLLGGLVADRLGRIPVAVGALVASAPLLGLGGREPVVLLAGLLVFQMTMPVTLLAVAEALPGRAAFAFGLPPLALIAGALPVFLGGDPAAGATLVVLVLGSAAALWQALRLMDRPALAAARGASGVPGRA